MSERKTRDSNMRKVQLFFFVLAHFVCFHNGPYEMVIFFVLLPVCGFWKLWSLSSGGYSVPFKTPFLWTPPRSHPGWHHASVLHKPKILPFNKFTEPCKNLWEYLVLHANIYQVKMDTLPQLRILGFFLQRNCQLYMHAGLALGQNVPSRVEWNHKLLLLVNPFPWSRWKQAELTLSS